MTEMSRRSVQRALLGMAPLCLAHCSSEGDRPLRCIVTADDDGDLCRGVRTRSVEAELRGIALSEDLDLDGRDDIVSSSGHVLWADGQQTALDLDRPATALSVGDTDGDGIGELYWGDGSSTLHRATLAGDRRWTVQALDFAAPIADFDLGDLDGDGTDDIVLATHDEVQVHWSAAAEEDAGPLVWTDDDVPVPLHIDQLPASGAFALRVDVGDFDGDGRLDVVSVGRWQAWYFRALGDRSFDDPTDAGLADARRPWRAGDFDDDGRDELFGVFPSIPGNDDRPEIRAVAFLDEPTWNHELIVLDAPARDLAVGPLHDDAIALVVDHPAEDDGGARVSIDAWDQGSLLPRLELELPLDPIFVAIANGQLLLLGEGGTGHWIDVSAALEGIEP